MVYSFPKQKLVYGPRQIVARINQEAEISRQISLWDQHGSQVIQGNLLVIPIEEALLYVRPLYLRSENGKIPELKRVIVAYENRIAMEETLEAAIARIFDIRVPETTENSKPSTSPSQSATGTAFPVDSSNLLLDAKNAYDQAIQAQRQGDWSKYGEEIKKLGNIIENMNRSSRSQKPQ